MRICVFCNFCLFLLVSCLYGQAPSMLSIRGEVFVGSSPAGPDLLVELFDLTRHLSGWRMPLAHDGTFEVKNVEAGSYEVRVTNARGDIVYQDLVNLHANASPLVLRIRGSDGSPHATGTVSAQSLLRGPVPGKAAKEFQRSQTAFEKGDMQGSIEHLEKAIRIYPDYSEAHINLGARYNVLQQQERAAAEFRKAIEIEPNSSMAHYDLSLSLFLLRRYVEAENAARRAVELAPHYLRARYALGLILTATGRVTPEALESLRLAATEFPKARLVAAQALERRGEPREAAAELKAFLSTGDSTQRKQVESWLARLQP